MEPLNRAKSAASETEAQLIDLLSAARATALPDSQKRSSLEAILTPKPQPAPWGLRLGRPALAFGILLCLAGASAAATIGARWMARRASSVPATAASRIEKAPPSVQVRPTTTVAAPREPSPVEAPIVRSELQSEVEFPRHAAPSRARGENPAALMEAVKALRQDHDPARASRLLREYLRLYPRGSLSEEARALSIEAARAQSSPNTVELANEYLRLYPHGRFRKAAAQAAGRSDP